MNKACVKCGKIMLVPDIPLPRNYTQKCSSCDHMNPVGEDLYYEEHPGDRPEDSIDLVDFDDRYVDPLDLSRGAMSQDNADEWMEKIKSHPLPMDDTASPPATLEDPFVPPAPEIEESFSAEVTPAFGPDPDALDVVQQVRREFAEVLESLKKERGEFQKSMEGKFKELALEIEALRSRPQESFEKNAEAAPMKSDTSQGRVAQGEVLLCSQDSKLIASCEKALKDVGLLVNTATNHDLARKRIQEFAYQTIVLDQQFVVGTKNGQAVLNSARKIALAVRRHQLVVMLTPGVPSCESQVFYQWGIDLNVHTDDLDELGGFVQDLIQLKSALLSPYLNSDLDTD